MFICNSKFKKTTINFSGDLENEISRINNIVINTIRILEEPKQSEILDRFNENDLDCLENLFNIKIINSLEEEILKNSICTHIGKDKIYVYDKNEKIIIYNKKTFSSIETKLNDLYLNNIKDILKEIYNNNIFSNLNDEINNIIKSFIDSIHLEDVFLFEDSDINFYKIKIEDLNNYSNEDSMEIGIEKIKEYLYADYFHENNVLEKGSTFKFEVIDDGNNISGIVIDNSIFCFNYSKIRQEIKKERIKFYDFYYINECLNFQNYVARKEESELLTEFKKMKRNENLLNQLSNLDKNIYSTEGTVHQELEDFFESGKLLEAKDPINLNFFLPKLAENDESLLGVYNNCNKTGTKGLKGWIDKKYKDQNFYQGLDQSKFKRPKDIKHLKPSLYYYYEKEFFEDLLYEIFTELKNSGKIIDFQHSVKTFYSKTKMTPLKKTNSDIEQEFDFIILTTDYKIIVFEAKTKLNSSYVVDQIKKTKKFMGICSVDKKNFIFEDYFLIGFNSDTSCEDYYHFFIENFPVFKEKPREKAYNFKVPIPIAGEEKFLNCLSDITYEGLLHKIEKGIYKEENASNEVLRVKKKNNRSYMGSYCLRKTKLFFGSRYLWRNRNFRLQS